MVLEFGPDELHAAARGAFGAERDAVGEALTAPDGLGVAIAIELAGRLVPPAADNRAVTEGATAVVSGLLVASQLVPGDGRIVSGLPEAVAEVRESGRSAVIARHCDLAGVADVERLVGSILSRQSRGDGALQESLLRLFEIGLALGLASLHGGNHGSPVDSPSSA